MVSRMAAVLLLAAVTALATGVSIVKRDAADTVALWPDATLWYEYADAGEFTQNEKAIINNALFEVGTRTKVQVLYKRKSTVHFLRILPNHDAHEISSQLGFHEGPNHFFVDREVLRGPNGQAEVLRHLMHVLGFSNEERRADRNDHVRINMDNVSPLDESKFDILNHDRSHIMSQPYDFGSILHSLSNAYAIDPTVATIVPIYPYEHCTLGGSSTLSDIDVARVNALYFPNDVNPILDPSCAPRLTTTTGVPTPAPIFQVRIRLVRYNNPDNKDAKGKRCDPDWQLSYKRCDPLFEMTYSGGKGTFGWNIKAAQDATAIDFTSSQFRDVTVGAGAVVTLKGVILDEDIGDDDLVGRFEVSHVVTGVTTTSVTAQASYATMTVAFEVVQTN